MPDFNTFQQKIDVSFSDRSLLETALSHTSYLNENPGMSGGSNQRLEFLGDSVLGLIIAERLFTLFPGLSEGGMTKTRAAVVRREALAEVARSLGMGDFILLGRGEEASGGRQKPLNLASALEALIAAIYMDSGFEAAREFVLRVFHDVLDKAFQESAGDCKSELQELVQSQLHQSPVYRLVDATGPDHERWFKVEVLVGEKVLGQGSGRKKKEAENEAACIALKELKR